MANIGNLNLKLTADATDFQSALEKTAADAQAWANKVSKNIEAPFLAMRNNVWAAASIVSGPVGTIGATLTKPIALVTDFAQGAAEALKSIPFIGGALAAVPTSAAGFITFLDKAIDRMTEVAKTAKRLGTDTESLSGLAYAAGGTAKLPDLTSNLKHFQVLLGGAAAGGLENQKVFRELGLDWEKLAKIPLAERIKALTDSYAKLSAVDRPGFLNKLFGKDNDAIAGVLAKGPEELRATLEKGKGKGLVFTDADVASMLEAKKALKDIGESIEGAGNALAVKLSPFIAAGAKGFQEMIDSAGPLPELLGKGIDAVIDVVAKLADALEAVVDKIKEVAADYDNLKDSFSLKNIALGVARGVALGPGGLTTEGLSGASAAAPSWGDAIRNLGKEARDKVAGLAGKGGDADGAALLFQRQSEAAQELTDQLTRQVETFGMGAAEAEIFKLKQQGLTDEMLAGARAAAKELSALEGFFQAAAPGATLTEKFRHNLAALNELFDKGEIGLAGWQAAMEKLQKEFDRNSAAEWAKALDAAANPVDVFKGKLEELQDLAEQLGKNTPEALDAAAKGAFNLFQGLKSGVPGALAGQIAAPQALEAGSAAELSYQTKIERQGLGGDIQSQIKTVLDAIAAKHDQELQQGREIIDALKRDDGAWGGGDL